ncbi:MAG: sugar ABC transporter permease [Thermomicrobiales bacterium]
MDSASALPANPPSPLPRVESTRTRWLRARYALSGYAMIMPAAVLLIVFVVAPVIYGLYLSLLRWNGFEPPQFVGLDNYIRLWERDRIFRQALTNNVIFAVSVVIGKNVLGLFLALLVNMKLRASIVFRTALFLPVTMSFVVIGLLWSWIYNPTFGLLDAGLNALGLGHLARPWLADPTTALWAIIAVDIWKWTGFHMVLYLAGLQTIPRDLLEAATIDGAGRWRRLLDVTLPLLAPVTFVNVLLALNGAFVRNFDLVYVMTGGGPNHQTEVVLTHMVAQAFRQGNLGYSAAMGYVLFIIVALISAVYIRAARAGTHDIQ